MKTCKLFGVIVLFFLLATSSFAEVSLLAKGWDWQEYNPIQKEELVFLIYDDFGVKGAYDLEKGIEAMDSYYADVEDRFKKMPKGMNYDFLMHMRCADVLGDMIRNDEL